MVDQATVVVVVVASDRITRYLLNRPNPRGYSRTCTRTYGVHAVDSVYTPPQRAVAAKVNVLRLSGSLRPYVTIRRGSANRDEL